MSQASGSPGSDDELRLNKAIAVCGYCSRRHADALILDGKVFINGRREKNPATRVTGQAELVVNGRRLRWPGHDGQQYFVLYKPVQTVCTVRDPEGRPTVMDCLPAQLRGRRLYPVGRLDYFSEGVLLLTNDGELTQRLTHPRYHQAKEYNVLVRGAVSARTLDIFRNGMRLSDGVKLLPVDAQMHSAPDGNTLLHLVLRQGVNRQIRRMCRDEGLVILKLVRVAHGPVRLSGLKPGQVRRLTGGEIRALRQSAGLARPTFSANTQESSWHPAARRRGGPHP